MTTLFRCFFLSAALFFSQVLPAADLHLNVFLGANPLKDLDIELDGRVLGATDERGGLSAPIGMGTHTVRLLKRSAALTEFRFETRPGESADLSITFTDFEQPAQVALDTYAADGVASGATGVVEGYVTDAEGYALAGAVVRIEEAGAEVASDDNGAFRFEIPRGRYTLSVSHPEFEPARQTGLRVLANVGIATRIALQPRAAESGAPSDGGAEVALPAAPVMEGGVATDGVQEITVVGTFKPAQQTAADIERFSSGVTDAISIDELLRFGDGDVAASLKRIVGISVADGKYAVVRGLDGRYIAATLNGSLMPSTDPFRRDVQLDLFPPDILGGIEIQKNFSAELPGETTGGILRMTTRGMPEAYVNKFSVSLGYVTDVTGEDLASYSGGDTDFLGYDDGLRELPGALRGATRGGLDLSICQVEGQAGCLPRQQAAQLAALLPNIYQPETESAAPDFGIAYTLGNRFSRDIGDVGLYGTVSYDRSSKSRQDAVIDDLFTASSYVRDQRNTAVNAYFVAGLEAHRDWEVLSKTLLLRGTEDTVEVESGISKSEGTSFNDVLLEWVERQFLAQQFEGKVSLFDAAHTLSWRAGISQTSRYSPDRRSYTYLNQSLALSTVERSYSDLTEDGLDIGIDYLFPVNLGNGVGTEVTVGALANSRERDAELVRLGVRQGTRAAALNQDPEVLFAAENFANDSFRLNARSTATDSYDAEQESLAFFVNTKTAFGERWTLFAGVRKDDFSQDLRFPNAGTTADLSSDEVLPSVSALFRLDDHWQFRAGYAATVSRPNITELAPSRFYDEQGREYIGCPTCEASTIDNFDFRAEYYFRDKDSVSLAIFTKEIDNPLERSVADGSGSAVSALTFRNNESATVSGIELDANVTLLDSARHGLSVGGNLAFIDSEIELDDVGARLEIDPKRELQGQSPFLANLQISWDYFPWGQKFTLLANYFDDRIDVVTRNQPPIEEKGRLLVNLAYEKALFSASTLSFKVKNLLDADVEYIQGGRTIEKYGEGLELSLGYSVRFD